MSFVKNSLRILERQDQFDRASSAGISLHCHTLYSKEMFDFVPFYAAKFPFVSAVWRRECRCYLKNEGRLPNFNLGFWEPPLTARQVFQSGSPNLQSIGFHALAPLTHLSPLP